MEVAHTAEIDTAAHAALEGSAKSPRETASSEAPPSATSPGGAGRAHATLGSTPGIDRILSGLGGVEPIASGGKTAAGSPQSGGRSGAPVGHFHFSRGGGNQARGPAFATVTAGLDATLSAADSSRSMSPRFPAAAVKRGYLFPPKRATVPPAGAASAGHPIPDTREARSAVSLTASASNPHVVEASASEKGKETAEGEQESEEGSATPVPPARPRAATTSGTYSWQPCECREKEHISQQQQPPPPPSPEPAPLPNLIVPRVLAIEEYCPSCTRRFDPIERRRTEQERLDVVLEDHWPCMVHLIMTGRMHANFGEQ